MQSKNVNKRLTKIMSNKPVKGKRGNQRNNKKVKKKRIYTTAPMFNPTVFRIPNPSYRPLRAEFGFKGIRTARARAMAQALKNMHERAELEYAAAVVEPELAIRTGQLIKQPSLIPIPSSTTTFKNSFVIKTDNNGSFFLNWVPNFLHTKQSLAETKTINGNQPYNVYTHLNALASTIGATSTNLIGFKCYTPTIALSKYRLVSAKIRITYIGTAMLNSGFMRGSISYDPAVVGAGYSNGAAIYATYQNANNTVVSQTTHDEVYDVIYRNFNENAILNGLWPHTVNLEGNGSGLSAVFIPTDPTDEIFYKLGLFYGDNPQHGLNDSGFAPLTSNDGAHSNYYFTGHGMDQNKECVHVETIYNFEIVPTAESAPLLRVTDQQPKGVSMVNVKEKIKDAIQAGLANKPRSNRDPSYSEIYRISRENNNYDFQPLYNARNYWKAVGMPLARSFIPGFK